MAKSPAMKIRRAVAADAAEIASLHKASISQLCSSHYSEVEIHAWAGPKKPADYHIGIGSGAVLIAEVGCEILGFSLFDSDEAELRALYVHPAHVGRGIGSALLEEVEVSARSSGLRYVRLNATLNSVGFYERLGYVSLGPAVNTLPTGEELPCIRMEKELVPGAAKMT
jgi:putative acetyltransferase